MLTEEQKSAFRRFLELRDARDEAKEAAKEAEEEYRTAEAELWDRMTVEGTQAMKDSTLKVPLGPPYGTVSFSPRETYYGRILNEERAMEYFEQRAMVEEMTNAKVSEARLNELVRNILDDENGVMPPGIDYYPRKGITITRPKS